MGFEEDAGEEEVIGVEDSAADPLRSLAGGAGGGSEG